LLQKVTVKEKGLENEWHLILLLSSTQMAFDPSTFINTNTKMKTNKGTK